MISCSDWKDALDIHKKMEALVSTEGDERLQAFYNNCQSWFPCATYFNPALLEAAQAEDAVVDSAPCEEE